MTTEAGASTKSRVGVLGGTFDPIHYGHLVAAEECWSALQLDRVFFVPAGEPPHKRLDTVSSPANRLAMVELAIADNAHFGISLVDVERPGPSYSVDMLAALRGQLGSSAELYFIVGLDSLADMLSWHNPARLIQLCQIVAVTRPGYRAYDLTPIEKAIPGARERITIVEIPSFDVSSTDLRRRVAQGRPIRYQLPLSVEEYIYLHRLYRTD